MLSNIKKILILIFILLNTFLLIYYFIYINNKNNITKDEFIYSYYENDGHIIKNNYIGYLSIPKINLLKGFYNINDKNNTISKNIQILKDDFPDKDNSILVFAAHSGNTSISFFKDLYKLKKEDLIYVYYKNFKYEYIVKDTYLEEKDGDIEFTKDKNILVLTTCSAIDKTKQLVIISKLVNKKAIK